MSLEPLDNPTSFWKGKSVFLTGHTGFKGGWLSLWLHALGARVTGYSLTPPTEPSLFTLAGLGQTISSFIGDIRDGVLLRQILNAAEPEIVIHMAAQPLVRDSYRMPVETYATNVMGTVNLLEAVRHCHQVRAVVNVTTDKCYDNQTGDRSLIEEDPLGGYDPYSSSKACSELVTAAWRSSFFHPEDYERHKVAIATARAGNVIGGGDWARDRLIPDCIWALQNGEEIRLRNPHAIRPWQHVLEPLSGYLLLAQRLYENGREFSGSWNFGPDSRDARSVEWIVKYLRERWGNNARYVIDLGDHPHEAGCLKLDSTKARTHLGWQPRWDLKRALDATFDWMSDHQSGANVAELCRSQIALYESGGELRYPGQERFWEN